jgi:hypothetical protein
LTTSGDVALLFEAMAADRESTIVVSKHIFAVARPRQG